VRNLPADVGAGVYAGVLAEAQETPGATTNRPTFTTFGTP
jgi:hypothetical protein